MLEVFIQRLNVGQSVLNLDVNLTHALGVCFMCLLQILLRLVHLSGSFRSGLSAAATTT